MNHVDVISQTSFARVTFPCLVSTQDICSCFVQHSSRHHILDRHCLTVVLKINLREVCIGAESTDFSPRTFPKFAFLFLFILTISTHQKHQMHTHTHTTTAVSYYILKIEPWVSLTRILRIFTVFSSETPFNFHWKLFSLFLIQLHCKDVFLLLALSSHKSCDFWWNRSEFCLLSQDKQQLSD